MNYPYLWLVSSYRQLILLIVCVLHHKGCYQESRSDSSEKLRNKNLLMSTYIEIVQDTFCYSPLLIGDNAPMYTSAGDMGRRKQRRGNRYHLVLLRQ